MAYPIEALTTEAQCDEVMQQMQTLKAALTRQKENKEQMALSLSNSSITLEADIAAATAEKDSLEDFIALQPAGKTREYYEARQQRIISKLEKLEIRRKQNTVAARFIRQLEIETLGDKIAEIDATITQIQAKKQSLSGG